MLILTRRVGETLVVGDDVTVTTPAAEFVYRIVEVR